MYLLTSELLPFQLPSNACMSDLDATLPESSDDDMSQRPVNSKQPTKANPQRTRAQAQAQASGSGTAPEAEKWKAGDVPMDGMSALKVPSLREQLTLAYEAKVAKTRATRDPRLLKGNTILFIITKSPKYLPKTYRKKYTYHNTYLNSPLPAAAAPNLDIVPEANEKILLPKPSTAKPTSYMHAPSLTSRTCFLRAWTLFL